MLAWIVTNLQLLGGLLTFVSACFMLRAIVALQRRCTMLEDMMMNMLSVIIKMSSVQRKIADRILVTENKPFNQ